DNRQAYSRAVDPSVAFDADGNFYVLLAQQNDAGSSGALVLHKYEFNGATPQAVFTNNVVHRWLPSTDAATNPSLAVDNGLRTFTDPDTGATQDNPYSGNVYVA